MTPSQRIWSIHENARLKLIEDRKQRIFLMKKHNIRVISNNGFIRVFMGINLLTLFVDYEDERESNIRRLIDSVTMALEIKEKGGEQMIDEWLNFAHELSQSVLIVLLLWHVFERKEKMNPF